MTANRRISAASIIGNTVAREKWLSIGIILTVTGALSFPCFRLSFSERSLTGSPAEISRDFPWQQSIFC